MAPLPRTGSTLLRRILNQNPDLWATPSTVTPEVLRRIQTDIGSYETIALAPELASLHLSLVRHGISAMYADRPERNIIDCSRIWGAPYYCNLLRGIFSAQEPKIIVTVRPLAEIVASFVRKARENPMDNFIDREMRDTDFWPYHRKPLDDARVDYLLSAGSPLQAAILSLASAYRDEYAGMFHIVQYEHLVTKPHETISGIYAFLGIPEYEHNFRDTQLDGNRFDGDVLGIPDMHTVRQGISVTAPAPETVLSDYGMTRCHIEDFWTCELQ